MPDLATISAFIGSIKTATELAKAIKGADLSIEKAETKLKMAELISALADAKIQAAEIQDLLQEKDERIKELEKSLETKFKLVRHKGRYYEGDENGKFKEEPFCTKCWEVDSLAVHLKHIEDDYYICLNCKNTFGNLPESMKIETRKSISYQRGW